MMTDKTLTALAALALAACGGSSPEPQADADQNPDPAAPAAAGMDISGLYLTTDGELYSLGAGGEVESTYMRGRYTVTADGKMTSTDADGFSISAQVEKIDGGLQLTAEVEGTKQTANLLEAKRYKGYVDELGGKWHLHDYINGEPQFAAEPVTIRDSGIVLSSEGAPYCQILQIPETGGYGLSYRTFDADGSSRMEECEVEAYQAGGLLIFCDRIHQPRHCLIIERK